MTTEQSICLNMIVKNESHIIEKTLSNLCSYINFTYWVICDTGSVDNTVSVITNFFDKRGILGEIFHHEWKDFGHNRTLALEAAFNKTDYLLIFDADDTITGNFKIPNLTADKYNLFLGSEQFKYVRPLIINNRKKWRFKGILHEYLEPLENINSDETINGEYVITSGKEGNRSKNSNKYANDAELLKKKINLIESSNNDIEDSDLLARYTFYCANSYKDCNDIHNAIFYYKKVLDYETWHQEKYMSALNIGDMYLKLNDNENAILYWYKAITYDKERREAVSQIMEYYYNTQNWFAINCLHEQIKNFEIKDVSSKLFLNISTIHNNNYYNSIASANISEWMSGYYSCKYLLMRGVYEAITISNFKCYAYNIHLDPDHLPFLEKLLSLYKKYYKNNKELIERLWNITSDNFKKNYNLDNLNELINLESSDTITLKSKNKISIEEASNKILIYTGFAYFSWNSSTIKEKAIGGSEKAVIYLSRFFPKNYKIYIAGDHIEEEVDNISYINSNKLQSLLDNEKFNTIIISRFVSFFEQYFNYKCNKLVIWAHDTCFLNNYTYKDVNDILTNNVDILDYVICLTKWHKDNIIFTHPCLKDKRIEIINNGINIQDFDTCDYECIKIKNKFIWSSCSERGLHILLDLWPKILEKLPDATLEICSYQDFPRDNDELRIEKIINSFDSITHHGKLNTKDLYELMKISEYWLYTNTFSETSCITAMEMLNSGVICIYYPKAGLVDTIGDYGIKVTQGNEINAILNLSEEDKTRFRKNGKEYATNCSWEKRGQTWSSVLKLNEKNKWIFVYGPLMNKIMIEDYIYNLNYLYTDYDISLISSTEILSQQNISKLTFSCPYFDGSVLKHFQNVEIGYLNFEPLNITFRLNAVLTVLRNFKFIQYYDYSKSNISIINNTIDFDIKKPIYLPYKCSENELKLLISYKNEYKNNYKNEYLFDFGIIHDWKSGDIKTKTITPPRRNKVVQFLIKNGFKLIIISGWGNDRDSQFAKCKLILNIHGQMNENETPPEDEVSNIFEHIRCNRILESGYNILSETSYELDTEFINNYSNLKIINYKDFFNLDILNCALNEVN